jgi:hypothetical protein
VRRVYVPAFEAEAVATLLVGGDQQQVQSVAL